MRKHNFKVFIAILLCVFSCAVGLGVYNYKKTHSIRQLSSGNKYKNNKRAKVLGASTSCDSELGNDAVCLKPSFPILPKSGGSFYDPVFGSKIIRVTDAKTAPLGAVTNTDPTSQMFNSNNTYFYVNYINQPAHLFKYDKENAKITDLGALSGEYLYDGAQWDKNNPNVFYTLANSQYKGIWKHTITSEKPLRIFVDIFGVFSSAPPVTDYSAKPMQMSADGNIFAAIGNSNPDGTDNDYIVAWDKTKHSSVSLYLPNQANGAVANNFILDYAGKNIFFQSNNIYGADLAEPAWFLWHLDSNTVELLQFTTGNNLSTEFAFGQNQVINALNGTLYSRSLNKINTAATLLDLPSTSSLTNGYETRTFSYITNDPENMISSSYVSFFIDPAKLELSPLNKNIYQYRNYLKDISGASAPQFVRYHGLEMQKNSTLPNTANQWSYDSTKDTLYVWLPTDIKNMDSQSLSVFEWQPLMEEIVQYVNTADGWTWRRLAHTRMNYNAALGIAPNANASMDHTLVLFNSNWDGTLKNADNSQRTDVFLLIPTPLKLPAPNPSPAPDTTPTPDTVPDPGTSDPNASQTPAPDQTAPSDQSNPDQTTTLTD